MQRVASQIESADHASKVPAVTLAFWTAKIFATTLGETGGDAVSMSMDLGYATASIIFLGILAVAVAMQVMARAFHPLLYWFVIVATTTAGTTIADFATRSLGIGYEGGSSILFAALLASLGIWYLVEGKVAVDQVSARRTEFFYWGTILTSQTLGTALGDWMADTNGLGYDGSSLLFGAGLLVLAILYYATSLSRTFLFWAAFILTRPLGATVGDFLDKPIAQGGLALDRFAASAVLLALLLGCVLLSGRDTERKA